MKTIWRLLLFMKPFWGKVFLAVLTAGATIAASIGLLGTSSFLISKAALHPSIADIQVAIVGVRFFGISRAGLRYLERLISHSINFRLLANLRTWFYQTIEPLAPAGLIENASGDLLARIVADIETLENFYVRVVAPPLTALLVMAGMSIFLGTVFAPQLGVILAVGMTINGLLIPLFIRKLSRSSGKASVLLRSELSQRLVEGVQGMGDLSAFGRAEDYFEQTDKISTALSREQNKMAQLTGLGSGLTLWTTNFTMLAAVCLAIPLVSIGKLDGVFLAVIAMMTTASFEATTPLPLAGQMLESSLEAARRLFEIADRQPAIVEPVMPIEITPPFTFSLKNICFSYSSESPILEDVSFTIPAGKKVVMVGASGEGKTTLLNLLLRFYEWQSGDILLNGISLRDIPGEQLRKWGGVIGQDEYIFNTTVRENLTVAREGASDAQLIEILTKVGLDSWFQILPQGLDTWLGERGVQMSGGERQRLRLARVLLKDSPIVFLDEPTANLDAITEQKLLEDLSVLLHHRTVFWITHRMTGLENADQILVLDKGKIVERGTHATLLKINALYTRMVQVQQSWLRE